MQDSRTSNIINTLSLERIEAYKKDGVDNNTALARYLWNISICQGLYPSLQFCEIALRNTMHNYLSKLYGEDWYQNGSVILTSWGQKQVTQATQSLMRMNKPISPGRVVAELQFGFWTHLLESHYETKSGFLPKGIKGFFPHLPKSQHNRKKLKAKLDRIRTLRNRVFHHERIIHWKDLLEQYQLIIEIINSINPDILTLASTVNHFEQTFEDGYEVFLKGIGE